MHAPTRCIGFLTKPVSLPGWRAFFVLRNEQRLGLSKGDKMQGFKMTWITKYDLPQILEIEKSVFQPYFRWSEEDLMCVLRQKTTMGLVYELEGKVVAYVIYDLHKDFLEILRIAVHRDFRGTGIGRKIIQKKMIPKLSFERRWKIAVNIPAENLAAQLFFSKLNFLAVKITSSDEYRMQYSLEVDERFIPQNRVKDFFKNRQHN
jgi:ribosomal-protein-alanine N-acetyltransferase